ncbi:hypothetical protein C6P85_22010, partial [Yersinia pestis]
MLYVCFPRRTCLPFIYKIKAVASASLAVFASVPAVPLFLAVPLFPAVPLFLAVPLFPAVPLFLAVPLFPAVPL